MDSCNYCRGYHIGICKAYIEALKNTPDCPHCKAGGMHKKKLYDWVCIECDKSWSNDSKREIYVTVEGQDEERD